MRPEHNFGTSLDKWEDQVFLGASHFVVFRSTGRSALLSGRRDDQRKQVPTFADAKQIADADPRALVYAVTETGRSVCLERKKWPHYEELLRQKETTV